MATYKDILISVNAYPIPHSTLNSICAVRGLELEAIATPEGVKGKEYQLAHADLLMWLANTPAISQGGQSYSFTEDQRKHFKAEANKIYSDIEKPKTIFGYKGSSL